MNKISDVLTKIFSQVPLETYFCKQHSPGAWIDNYSGCAKTFQNQKLFKPIATGKVRDEHITLESNRTSSMSEKIQTKQSLLSVRVSSRHHNSHIISTEQVS